MVRTFFVALLLPLIFCVDAVSQVKQPLQRKKDLPKAFQSLGLTAGFNQISGLSWEFQLTDKQGQFTRSTVTFTGGYSSRWPEYEKLIRKDSSAYLKYEREWTHGAGFSGALNYYLKNDLEGMYWTVAAGGHIFFRPGQHLKTMNVSVFFGYKKRLNENIDFHTQAGAGLMGSPFKSTSNSSVNGVYAAVTASLQYRIN